MIHFYDQKEVRSLKGLQIVICDFKNINERLILIRWQCRPRVKIHYRQNKTTCKVFEKICFSNSEKFSKYESRSFLLHFDIHIRFG